LHAMRRAKKKQKTITTMSITFEKQRYTLVVEHNFLSSLSGKSETCTPRL